MTHISFEGEQGNSLPFFRPVNDGKITRKITKDEYERRIAADAKDNVRAREWSTPKNSGVAYEEIYSAISGRIVAIKIRDHEQYGRSIAVTLRQKNGAEGIFATNTGSDYGISFMEKLPGVNLEKEVRISAFVKTVNESTRHTTLLNQGDARIESFFKKYDPETKVWTISHGYPVVEEKEKKKYGDKYWSQRYFPECSVFLVEYIEKNIAPKVNELSTVVTPETDEDDITLVENIAKDF